MMRNNLRKNKWIKMFTAFVLLCIFLVSFSNTTMAGTLPNESSVSGNQIEDLKTYVNDEFEKSHIPGMSFEIVSGSETLLAENYGEAESCDQPFMLGSLSKSFTALAIMQLVEKGMLSVDDCVAKYIPEFDQKSKTTIRQLLTHTSGMKTSAVFDHYSSSDVPAPYTYSNLNYNLLGMIVENVSGMNYGVYIKNQIFQPLGMTHSYVSYEDAKKDNLIPGNRNMFGLYYHAKMPYPIDLKSDWMSLASAYLISTANDMGKYMQWYLSDSHPEVLSTDNRKRMFTETIDVIDNYEYGFGFGINDMDGKKLYMHGGNLENYTSYLIMIPEKNIGIIALTNSCDFLVADAYTISIPTNVACKIIGHKTDDISSNQYWKSHMIYNLIMLTIIVACLLPVFFYKHWRKNMHHLVTNIFSILVFHIIVPTGLLTVFGITMDRPLDVVARFGPDVFLVLCISATSLYFIGIAKVYFLIKSELQTRNVSGK